MPRPKGTPKTGGRHRGTKNKKTREQVAKVTASGLTPLEYMLQVMRNEELPRDERMDAAYKSAPYVHPRLTAIEQRPTTDPAEPVNVVEPQIVDARKPDA